MRGSKIIHVISAYAEREVGDVIVGGVAPLPGSTLWVRAWIAEDQTLRNFVLQRATRRRLPSRQPAGADEAHDIAHLGVRTTKAANAALGFTHPTNPDWTHISFCLFAGPLTRTAEGLRAGAAVAIQPGKVDRSPTGTALSARMAVLTAVSLIGSTFTGRILGTTTVGDTSAVLPEISSRGWITGIHQHMLDSSDPWPGGYRLTATWGAR